MRARELLELDLFRDPPPQARDPRGRLALIGFFCLAVVVQLLRMWSSRPLDSLFIEDASVWLPGALSRDTLEALSTRSMVTCRWSPGWSPSPSPRSPWRPMRRRWRSPARRSSPPVPASCGGPAPVTSRAVYLRGALVALMILLPVVGTNALATVTNSIWFLLYACMWALLWRPESRGETAVAAGVVALAALSNLGVRLPASDLARSGAGDPRPPRLGDRRRLRDRARRPDRVLGRRDRASRRGG